MVLPPAGEGNMEKHLLLQPICTSISDYDYMRGHKDRRYPVLGTKRSGQTTVPSGLIAYGFNHEDAVTFYHHSFGTLLGSYSILVKKTDILPSKLPAEHQCNFPVDFGESEIQSGKEQLSSLLHSLKGVILISTEMLEIIGMGICSKGFRPFPYDMDY